MKIYPKEIADTICPCCGVNKCDPDFTSVQSMYRILSVSNGNIRIYAHIKIPKCRECENNSWSAIAFPIALLAIFVIISFVSLLCGGLTFWGFLGSNLLAIVVSLICWWIAGLGVNIIYKMKGVRSYKPIRILRKYGWRTYNSEPKNTSKFWSVYTEEKHNKMLREIMKDDEYVIQ